MKCNIGGMLDTTGYGTNEPETRTDGVDTVIYVGIGATSNCKSSKSIPNQRKYFYDN